MLGVTMSRVPVLAARGLLAAIVPSAVAGGSVVYTQAAPPVTFTDHIRPIFERSCWNCYGEVSQLSDLDLRTRETAILGEASGPALVPGRADQSRLCRMLAGLDDPRMPMGGDTLSAADALAALENTELPPGARDYWAFQRPVQAPVPVSATFEHPVDRFLDAARRDGGVTAAPRADGLTRLWRAYLDLTGLPPTLEQIDEFLADTDRGAWERLIDRLLDSPHYGERWGRHWMDVARHADSTGFEQDYTRPNAWRYRRARACPHARSAGDAGRGAVRYVRSADPREPVRAIAVTLRAAGDRGHLALHERRYQPGRHLRPEASADQLRGPADGRLGRRAPGASGPAHAEPVLVPEAWAERDRGVGDLSAPGEEGL